MLRYVYLQLPHPISTTWNYLFKHQYGSSLLVSFLICLKNNGHLFCTFIFLMEIIHRMLIGRSATFRHLGHMILSCLNNPKSRISKKE